MVASGEAEKVGMGRYTATSDPLSQLSRLSQGIATGVLGTEPTMIENCDRPMVVSHLQPTTPPFLSMT